MSGGVVCPWKRWTGRCLTALALLFAPLPAVAGASPGGQPPPLLARVEVDRPLGQLGLPVFAHFGDGNGCEVALVVATRGELVAAGVPFQILDTYLPEVRYLLATERRPGVRRAVLERYVPLLDDGRYLLLHARAGLVEELQALGMASWRLPDTPLSLREPVTPLAAPVAYDPLVASMLAQVEQGAVLTYARQLSGAEAVTVGGSSYTISRRQTNSGVPIDKATQYVAEHLQRQGLSASYHPWSASGYSGRNVSGLLPGGEHAGEVVLVTAHLDDMPATGTAPGADDNASGSVAVMVAAEVMHAYTFDRTLQFVFFTGEEQGLLGSGAYAASLAAAGTNVVAVVNLDMIAYDTVDGPVLELHTRASQNPGYAADRAIADAFRDVVTVYGLGAALEPTVVADGIPYSDHAQFWNRGFPAILGIEDTAHDFNAQYHKVTDTVENLNPAYFTAFVRAAVGTVAHLAGPTGIACTAPAAPELTAPAGASSGTPYLVSWTATSADGTYVLEEARESTFATPSSFALAATAAAFLHASGGDTFHYRVRAVEACGGGSVASEWSLPAAVPLEGGGGCELEVADRTISGAEVFLSCGELSAGPDLLVASSGAATLRAASVMILRNGVRVTEGGYLAAGTDSALAEP
ncbi:MAG: M20/M25/M40 family metallo-hydrolase [Thermoanaerobaculaceae bacterium]|nr:M20/M25/M40 family metallo-hydrolase [Thermoanaerobaculaceae bacterium]